MTSENPSTPKKPVKRQKQKHVFALVLLFFALVIALLFWSPFLSQPWIRNILTSQISKTIGAQITFEKMDLDLFPFRFQIHDIHLKKQKGTYLNIKVDVETIDASIRWKSFWSEQMFFRYINIKSPTVLVSIKENTALENQKKENQFRIPSLPVRTGVVFEDVNVENIDITFALGKDVTFALDHANVDFQFTDQVQAVNLKGEGYFQRDEIRKKIPLVHARLEKKDDLLEIKKVEISDSIHNFVMEGSLLPDLQLSSYLYLQLPSAEKTLQDFSILNSSLDLSGSATVESQWSGSISQVEHQHKIKLDQFSIVERDINKIEVLADMKNENLHTAEIQITEKEQTIKINIDPPNSANIHPYQLTTQKMTFNQVQKWIAPDQEPLILSDLDLQSNGTLSLSPFKANGDLVLGIQALEFNLPANVARFLPLQIRNIQVTSSIGSSSNEFFAMRDGEIQAEDLSADFDLAILPDQVIEGDWIIQVADVQGIFSKDFAMAGMGEVAGGIEKKGEVMNLHFGLDFEDFEYESYGKHALDGKLVFETGLSRYQDFRMVNDDGGLLRFEGSSAQVSDEFDVYGEFEKFSLDFIGAMVSKAYPIAKQIRGIGDGKIRLTGVEQSVQGQITLDAKDVWVFDQPDFDVKANVLFEDQSIIIEDIQIKGSEMNLMANGTIENDQAKNLTMQVEKFPLAQMGLPTIVTAYAGYVDGDVHFSGPLEDLNVDAKGLFLEKNIQTDEVFKSKAQFSVQGPLSDIDWTFLALDQSLDTRGELVKVHETYALSMYGSSELFPFLSMIEGTQTALSASWKASGRLNDFSTWNILADIEKLSMVNPQITFENQQPFVIEVVNGETELENIILGNVDYQFNLSGGIGAEQNLDIAINGYLPFEALSIVPMDLQRIEGTAEIDAQVAGQLSNPILSGQLNVERGYIQHKVFPHALENLSLAATIDQNQLQIRSLTALLGGGEVQAQGDIYLDADVENMSIFLNGEISEASLRFPEFLPVTIAGPFSVEGPLTKPLLKGDFEVLQGMYQDEWDWQSQILTFGGAQEVERVYFEDEESLLFSLRFNINNDNFLVRNEVALAQIHGDITLTGSNLQWGMIGELKIVEGQVTFLDNEFELSPGSVNFIDEEEIAFSFNINARTRVENTDINLDIRTEEEQIRAYLSSIPPKEETTLISLLTLGVELDDLAVSSTSEQGVSASLIPSVLSGPVQSKLQSGLKKIKLVDSFQFIPYFSQDTKTTGLKLFVAKNLFSKVRLTYTTDLFEVGNENTFVVEQFLNDNVSIQASFRDNQEEADKEYDVGLDFEYRTEF